MNKILHINVGGYPFSIDDIAYEKLDMYLLSLRNHFEKSEGCKEIMQDIEESKKITISKQYDIKQKAR